MVRSAGSSSPWARFVKPVAVKLYPDTSIESTETVVINVIGAHPTSSASALTVDVARSGTITILDDDAAI